ncbi:MAG: hypothetical protein HQM13_03870 [SAR324 cluster bacterium]|nr:hypothetical protein [SAR324 cluster bacterium]
MQNGTTDQGGEGETMRAIFKKLSLAVVILTAISLLQGCADLNKERAVDSIGTYQSDGSISVRLTALDIDVQDASQNESQSNLNFKLRLKVDNDLCDLVDVQVLYQIQYDLNHPDPQFGGKRFSFSSALGRIKRGHSKTETIQRATNGPVALDSIGISQVVVRDLQNCTIDPFRPI